MSGSSLGNLAPRRVRSPSSLAAGVRANGQLSPMLRDRMDAAIRLYQSGTVGKILVSGDNSTVNYNEPGRMYDYAVARGVSPADITRDYAGRRTYDTCYRASAIFGVKEALLVTQRFHLPRALFTCRSFGIDAVGVAADPAHLPVERLLSAAEHVRDRARVAGRLHSAALAHPRAAHRHRVELNAYQVVDWGPGGAPWVCPIETRPGL